MAKVKLTVSLDESVAEALDPLCRMMEKESRKQANEEFSESVIFPALSFSRSEAVQAALVAYMNKLGVQITPEVK